MADHTGLELILGSASPRRADLLTRAGYTFHVRTVEIDEPSARLGIADGDIVAATLAIASAKFEAFEKDEVRVPEPLLLTADTLVACRGVTMGKPDSADAVAAMLAHMSGQRLSITTALCLGKAGRQPRMSTVTTGVQLVELGSAQIEQYVEAKVGLDKAAGLALQSEARPFVSSLDRCWSNVLGLPLCAMHSLWVGDPEGPEHHCVDTRCNVTVS